MALIAGGYPPGAVVGGSIASILLAGHEGHLPRLLDACVVTHNQLGECVRDLRNTRK